MLLAQLFTSSLGLGLIVVWAALLAIAKAFAPEYEARRFLRWALAVVGVGVVLLAAVGGGRDSHVWATLGAGLLVAQALLLAWLVARGASPLTMFVLSAAAWVVIVPVFAVGGFLVMCSLITCA
ncbi:MAG: hypothetical protein HOQ01_06285 [Lysobacter sp.]|nr:hypothetical protein [Lysobacter sp.]